MVVWLRRMPSSIPCCQKKLTDKFIWVVLKADLNEKIFWPIPFLLSVHRKFLKTKVMEWLQDFLLQSSNASWSSERIIVIMRMNTLCNILFVSIIMNSQWRLRRNIEDYDNFLYHIMNKKLQIFNNVHVIKMFHEWLWRQSLESFLIVSA